MKTFCKLMLPALAALRFVSCSDDDNNSNSNGPVKQILVQ